MAVQRSSSVQSRMPVLRFKHAAGWESLKNQVLKDHRVDLEKAVQELIRSYETLKKQWQQDPSQSKPIYPLYDKAKAFLSQFYPKAHPGWLKAIMSLMSEQAGIEWPRKRREVAPPTPAMVLAEWNKIDVSSSHSSGQAYRAMLERVVRAVQAKHSSVD